MKYIVQTMGNMGNHRYDILSFRRNGGSDDESQPDFVFCSRLSGHVSGYSWEKRH